jgi:hypothetical protein
MVVSLVPEESALAWDKRIAEIVIGSVSFGARH